MKCKICNTDFNPNSPEKRAAGGKIYHCADCAEESAVKYIGLGDGCGKQTSIQILSFETQADQEQYLNYWHAASGMHNGKASHMAYLPSPIKQKFRKVSECGGNHNHKGKLE